MYWYFYLSNNELKFITYNYYLKLKLLFKICSSAMLYSFFYAEYYLRDG